MTVQVVSICGALGFPVGLATTQTMLYLAKALLKAGMPVTVLHCGPNPYSDVQQRVGVHDGIPYRYLTCVGRRPDSAATRVAVYLLSYLEMAYRLACLRLKHPGDRVVVCLYAAGSLLNVWVAALCAVLRIPIVVETSEWVPDLPGTRTLDRWIYLGLTFRACSGSIVISKLLDERIRLLPGYRRRPFPIYRRTIFVDQSEFAGLRRIEFSATPSLVWSGDVDSYFRDVAFLLAVAAELKKAKCACDLVIVGPCSSAARELVKQAAASAGLDDRRLHVLGYVDRSTLLDTLAAASVFIQPLWDDVQSKARFPNKLGEYLLSGRPVVSCAVGEVAEHLTDNANVLFYRSGDASDCAKKVRRLLENPAWAATIGATGRVFAERTFSYHAHAGGLADFFGEVAGCASRQPCPGRDGEFAGAPYEKSGVG